jgi:hypothetical protein
VGLQRRNPTACGVPDTPAQPEPPILGPYPSRLIAEAMLQKQQRGRPATTLRKEQRGGPTNGFRLPPMGR